jgi:hypothetical protein
VVLAIVACGRVALAAPCEPELYVSPSLMLAAGSVDSAPWYVRMPSNAAAPLGRLAIGSLVERCDDATPWLQLRFGLTGTVSSLHIAQGGGTVAGVGAEVEVDLPFGSRWLGGRFGAETASSATAMLALGPRFHLDDVVWFGLDGFVSIPHHFVDCTEYAVPGCTTHVVGVMAGAGLEAHPGGALRRHVLVVGGVVVTIGALVTAVAIAAQGFHL